jgi:hypothetical protein
VMFHCQTRRSPGGEEEQHPCGGWDNPVHADEFRACPRSVPQELLSKTLVEIRVNSWVLATRV